jgi:hypothetical protein
MGLHLVEQSHLLRKRKILRLSLFDENIQEEPSPDINEPGENG